MNINALVGGLVMLVLAGVGIGHIAEAMDLSWWVLIPMSAAAGLYFGHMWPNPFRD